MPKRYRVGIVWEYEPDENNMLPWEDEYQIEDEYKDEDFTPRSEGELIIKLKNEIEEAFYTAMNNNDLWDMIHVEVIEEDN